MSYPINNTVSISSKYFPFSGGFAGPFPPELIGREPKGAWNSSAWITDASGNVNPHLAYMPFGEDFINERSNRDIRFKFTGKERDGETGFDYFGARCIISILFIE